MKIAISAEGPDLAAQVGHRFGTSPYLIIVDTQTMAFEAVSNPAEGSQGGAGVMAVVLSINKEVDAVLTGYCSPTAARYLFENGIEALTGISATAADAVEQYKKRDMHDTGDAVRKIKPRKTQVDRSAMVQALKSSTHQFVNLVPIFMAVILSIGLFTTFISTDMDPNSKNGKQVPAGKKHVQRMLLFPALVVAIYGALFTFTPDRSKPALHNFNNDQGDII